MPFSGNTFVRNQNFVSDRNGGPPNNTISADKVDNEFDNLSAGLTTVKTAHETQKSLFPTLAYGTGGTFLRVNTAGTAYEFATLTLLPTVYSTHRGQYLRVNSAGTGYEVAPLTLVPEVSAGAAGRYLRVNGTGTQYELRTMDQVRGDIVPLPDIQVYTVAGSYSWTVPANVTRVWVELYGGGGGTSSYVYSNAKYAHGGGGGGYCAGYVNVTPGSTIPIVVGAAGVSSSTGAGTSGTASSFGGVMSALGGKVSSTVNSPGYAGGASGGAINLAGGAGGMSKTPYPSEGMGGVAAGPFGGRRSSFLLGDMNNFPGGGGGGFVYGPSDDILITGAAGGAVYIRW